MSIRTSIHFGQQHQCRGKWVFYLSKATFKYIEDFISPLLMRRCFVLQQFYHSDCALRHAAFARNTRDENLNSAHLFAAKNNKVSCVISRWHACPSFPLQAFVLCMHVCNCLIVLWPPWIVILPWMIEFRHIPLIHRENHLTKDHVLSFLPTPSKEIK